MQFRNKPWLRQQHTPREQRNIVPDLKQPAHIFARNVFRCRKGLWYGNSSPKCWLGSGMQAICALPTGHRGYCSEVTGETGKWR